MHGQMHFEKEPSVDLRHASRETLQPSDEQIPIPSLGGNSTLQIRRPPMYVAAGHAFVEYTENMHGPIVSRARVGQRSDMCGARVAPIEVETDFPADRRVCQASIAAAPPSQHFRRTSLHIWPSFVCSQQAGNVGDAQILRRDLSSIQFAGS